MSHALNVMHPIKRIGNNSKGRDFVVADLHGCRGLLEARLAAIGFNRAVDRLFSVGDLIDRGPTSYETLCLIVEPWFEFVIGNHEAMLLTYLHKRYSNYHSPIDFLYNGGDWFEELTPAQVSHFEKVLLPVLLNAPLVLRVEDDDAPFHVLHAEAMKRGNRELLTDLDLANPDSVDAAETSLNWSRRLVGNAESALAFTTADGQAGQLIIAEPGLEPGLSLTYVGHSILAHPVLHRSHLFLDCGAYLENEGEGYLMLVEHRDVVTNLRLAGISL